MGQSVQCARRIAFCAGHRVLRHEGKCAHLHGHNYVAILHAGADALDHLGRVVDFSDLKHKIGGWIDEHWDHGFILYREDEEAIRALSSLQPQKLYLMDSNPTVENIALHLLCCVAPRLMAGTDVRIVRVQLWETENCLAEVSVE